MFPEVVPESFWKNLGKARRCILMLDYDGTLAPFHEDRDQAVPYRGVVPLLERIMEDNGTRLVIVSGRWTRDILRLLPLRCKPEIFGSHGLERLLPDGRYQVLNLGEKMIAGLAEIDEMAINGGLEERIERKPGCLALHWRGLDEQTIKGLRQIVQDEWQKVATQSGLSVTEFNGGMEIRAPDRNKGDAVQMLLEEEPEDAIAVYLGDDKTDEDAFEALTGRGLGVLVTDKARTSSASIYLKPPLGVLDFLKKWGETRKV
jgi:trehalose 6-phosphate phosphatase